MPGKISTPAFAAGGAFHRHLYRNVLSLGGKSEHTTNKPTDKGMTCRDRCSARISPDPINIMQVPNIRGQVLPGAAQHFLKYGAVACIDGITA